MLDHEFASLLGEDVRQNLPRNQALELSRLVVRSDIKSRDYRNCVHPVEYLLKELYSQARNQGYNNFYIVVEEKWPAIFARRFGLPFRVIGAPYTFLDGTRTIVATASIEELEAGIRRHNMERYNWYQTLAT